MQWFADWYMQSTSVEILIVPAMMSFCLAVFLGRHDETDEHARANIAATLVVYFANIVVAVFLTASFAPMILKLYQSLGVPQLPADIWIGVPVMVVVLIGVAAKDFVDYWTHRWMHTRWLWPTHAAHHSDTHVNAFTSYRVHIFEIMVMQLNHVFLLTWLQMPELIPLAMALTQLHNFYVHLNVEIDHGPFKYLVASPIFHRWHHADAPEAYGKNLANLMPIYDKIFGTYYVPGPCRKPMGALSSGIEDKNPILIYIYPFQEWGRLIKQTLSRSRRTRREQQASD